jgi:O-antigen/teichoic acid export membrane protein
MNKLLKISHQTLWQAVVKAITSICGFFIIGAVSRTYGETGTGNFTLALVYIGFFYVLLDFSFNAHILSRLDDQNSELEWRKLFGTRLLWSVFLSVLYVLVIFLLPYSQSGSGFSPIFKFAALILVINIFFDSIIATCEAFFQAKLKYEYDSTGPMLGAIFGTILIIWLVSINSPVQFLVLGYVLAWFINSLGSLFFVKKFVKNLSPIFDFNYMKKLFIDIWPLAATLVLNVVYFRADSFMISYFKGSSDVGIYNVAYQIFQAVLVFPTYIMNAFYPVMLDTLRNNAKKFVNEIRVAFIGLITISIIAVTLIYFFSPTVIKLITGSGFSGSITSLQILSLGLPAYFLSALGLWILVAKKQYKLNFYIYIIGLAFNLLANLIFIPRYSYIASSWITIVSEYLILVLQIIILIKGRFI